MRRSVLLLLLCISFSYSTGYRRADAEGALLRAARAVRPEERRAAIAGLDRLVRDKVQIHDALLWRGDLLRAMGEDERALHDFREVVRTPNGNPDASDIARRRIDNILKARVDRADVAIVNAWAAKDYRRGIEQLQIAAELCLQSDFLVRRPGDGLIEQKLAETWLHLASTHAALHALFQVTDHVDQVSKASERWNGRIADLTSDPAVRRRLPEYLAQQASAIADQHEKTGDQASAELFFFICSEQSAALDGNQLVTRCRTKTAELQARLGITR